MAMDFQFNTNNAFFYLFFELVEMPNYSTESSEEQSTREDDNYYYGSSSGELDSQPTDDFDSYGMNSIEPYHSNGSTFVSKYFSIFVAIVLIRCYN